MLAVSYIFFSCGFITSANASFVPSASSPKMRKFLPKANLHSHFFISSMYTHSSGIWHEIMTRKAKCSAFYTLHASKPLQTNQPEQNTVWCTVHTHTFQIVSYIISLVPPPHHQNCSSGCLPATNSKRETPNALPP